MVPLDQIEQPTEECIENGMEDNASIGSGSSTTPTATAAAAAAAAAAATATETVKYTLKHMDFMPNLLPGKKEDEFEKFP